MSLAPKITSSPIIVGGTASLGETQPNKTYHLDLENGILSSTKIDGDDAVRQFIQKTIRTARFNFLIYSSDYGCELEEIIGHNISNELLKDEIPRVIRESLLIDDRIQEVSDFVIEKKNENIFISFKVTTTNGTELIEEVSV